MVPGLYYVHCSAAYLHFTEIYRDILRTVPGLFYGVEKYHKLSRPRPLRGMHPIILLLFLSYACGFSEDHYHHPARPGRDRRWDTLFTNLPPQHDSTETNRVIPRSGRLLYATWWWAMSTCSPRKQRSKFNSNQSIIFLGKEHTNVAVVYLFTLMHDLVYLFAPATGCITYIVNCVHGRWIVHSLCDMICPIPILNWSADK